MLEGQPPSGQVILLAPHKLRLDLGLVSFRPQKGKLRLRGRAKSEEAGGLVLADHKAGVWVPRGTPRS